MKGKTLKEIAEEYFKKHFLYEELQESNYFNGIISFKGAKIGLIVKDWNRTIGINQIRTIEERAKNFDGMQGVVIISNNFSTDATKLASERGIEIASRYEIEEKMNMGMN